MRIIIIENMKGNQLIEKFYLRDDIKLGCKKLYIVYLEQKLKSVIEIEIKNRNYLIAII